MNKRKQNEKLRLKRSQELKNKIIMGEDIKNETETPVETPEEETPKEETSEEGEKEGSDEGEDKEKEATE